MNNRTFKNYLTVGVIGTLTLIQGFAHSVWIEPDQNGKLVARFGEFGDDPETSPGYLDSLDAFTAWKVGDEKPIEIQVEKQKDGFSITSSAKETAQVKTGFPVMTRGSSPARKPHFYARWAPSFNQAGTASMTLDLVPTGIPGEVQVMFLNQPLADVDVTLYTPEANDQELKSDKDGKVRFSSSEKGLFMLKIGRYREERTGFDRGTVFQLVSHNCSLSWIQK